MNEEGAVEGGSRGWVSDVIGRSGVQGWVGDYLSTRILTKYWYSRVGDLDIIAFG